MNVAEHKQNTRTLPRGCRHELPLPDGYSGNLLAPAPHDHAPSRHRQGEQRVGARLGDDFDDEAGVVGSEVSVLAPADVIGIPHTKVGDVGKVDRGGLRLSTTILALS